ncbi:MAG: hypothetical protein OXE52_03390 [Chloroflexi bacterium]|nr:hypothetical protein [Chloroflexota bacterium]
MNEPSPTARRRTAEKIAAIMGEHHHNQISQIDRILKFHGLDQVKAWLRDAKRIMDEGGMKTMDGKRDRTFGGIFFYLVKADAPKMVTPRDIDSIQHEEPES